MFGLQVPFTFSQTYRATPLSKALGRPIAAETDETWVFCHGGGRWVCGHGRGLRILVDAYDPDVARCIEQLRAGGFDADEIGRFALTDDRCDRTFDLLYACGFWPNYDYIELAAWWASTGKRCFDRRDNPELPGPPNP